MSADKKRTGLADLITRHRTAQDSPQEPANDLAAEQPSKQAKDLAAELKPFGTYLPPDLIRRLKVHAVTHDRRIQDVVAEALEVVLAAEQPKS